MDDAFERLARVVLSRSPDIAHDLKTPLNIAVLSVELLQMRLRRLSSEVASDEKVLEHCRALEQESRRVAAIMDAFLSIASLPGESAPEQRDLAAVLTVALREKKFELDELPRCIVTSYPSRVQKTGTQLAEGVASTIVPGESRVESSVDNGKLKVVIQGPLRDPAAEVGKLFKFYYTDPAGEPSTTLASARLLLETVGGAIEMRLEDGSPRFEIQIQGDQ